MFKKAERKQAKLKIALTGPSGSGKTYSALLIASGIGKKIAVVDTENSSASLYADRFEFDTVTINPPYTVQKYVEALKAAEAAGFEVLVIDSLTHAWAGAGGLLDKKEALDVRGGNSFTNWGSITKEHELFKGALLNAKMHLICTMRSKQDYVLETNEKGKSAPRKVGLAPIQREGMEYEFTTVFDLGMDHSAMASKDRTSIFDGQVFKPTKETGESLLKWLMSGKAEEPKTEEPKQAETMAGASSFIGSEVEDDVDMPKNEQKVTAAPCQSCGTILKLNSIGTGYICPNSKEKKDGHTRILASKLTEYMSTQIQKPTQEKSQYANS